MANILVSGNYFCDTRPTVRCLCGGHDHSNPKCNRRAYFWRSYPDSRYSSHGSLPYFGADCTMARTQGNGMVLRMPGMQGAECWVEESDGGENKLWGMRGSFFSQRIEQAPPSLTSVEFSLAKMTVPWQRLCLELESLSYG